MIGLESTLTESRRKDIISSPRRAIFLASDAAFSTGEHRQAEPRFARRILRSFENAGYDVDSFLSPHYRRVSRVRMRGVHSLRGSFHTTSTFFALASIASGASSLDLSLMDRLRKAWLEGRTRTFRHFLKKHNPHFLLGIGLGPPELLAARDLGVRTVEIQHGEIDSSTLDMYFPNVWPDFFLHWFQGDSVLFCGQNTVPIHVGLMHSDQEFDSPASRKREGVVVLLQHHLAESVDSMGCCHPSIISEISQLEPGTRVLVRGHPTLKKSQQLDVWREIRHLLPTAEFQPSDRAPLKEDLSRAMLSLSHSSAGWIDSLVAGCPTVLTSSEAYNRALMRFPSWTEIPIFGSIQSCKLQTPWSPTVARSSRLLELDLWEIHSRLEGFGIFD